MRSISVATVFALASYVAAAPYGPFPLADGFPSPTPAQLAEIETLAGGTLPNGPLPTALKPDGVAALQLIALNEIFEVAYFTELLNNITTKVPGYELTGYNSTYITQALTAIVNASAPPFRELHKGAFSKPNLARTTARPRRQWHSRKRKSDHDPAMQV